MKQNPPPEFQVVQGATFQEDQLVPSYFSPCQASKQLLISNTGIVRGKKLYLLQSVDVEYC